MVEVGVERDRGTKDTNQLGFLAGLSEFTCLSARLDPPVVFLLVISRPRSPHFSPYLTPSRPSASACLFVSRFLIEMPSLASSTARTTNSIWQLGSAGLPAGPGPSFLFLWHCSRSRPRPAPAELPRPGATVQPVEGIGGPGGREGGGVRPWSRQVGFDKADKGNLHASGDTVLGVDLECNQ